MSQRSSVLARLADGRFHSGTEIGRSLGVTRAAVHKVARQLTKAGIALECRRGLGYRLDPRFRPLALAAMTEYWPAASLHQIELLEEVDSTNRYLLRQADRGLDIHGHCCLAESQTGGVGRRGRTWVSTAYSNILLSCAWRFDATISRLGGLSLAVGVAARAALVDCGLETVRLKWPNDLVCGPRKLGGVLIELRAQAEAPTLVVCGIGINGYIAPGQAPLIDQPWTDLEHELGVVVDRNRVAAALLRHLINLFDDFARHGFAAWRPVWERYHRDTGRFVQVIDTSGRHIGGEALGADEHGGLRLRAVGGIVTVYAGDVGIPHEPSD
ncbi:MAG: biotin--[acetyl-CoA-carboxylase] ligase [Acidiferrobacteraceae bacterium]